MKVSELIEKLQEMPADAEVFHESCCFGVIRVIRARHVTATVEPDVSPRCHDVDGYDVHDHMTFGAGMPDEFAACVIYDSPEVDDQCLTEPMQFEAIGAERDLEPGSVLRVPLILTAFVASDPE